MAAAPAESGGRSPTSSDPEPEDGNYKDAIMDDHIVSVDRADDHGEGTIEATPLKQTTVMAPARRETLKPTHRPTNPDCEICRTTRA